MNPHDARVSHDLHALACEVKALARGLGFDLVGIAPAAPSERAKFYRQWIADGKAGEMSFLADRIEQRLDPTILLPNARTVVCVAMNYHANQAGEVATPGDVRIARYARADDYHELIKPKLYAIADYVRDASPGCETRCGVDTAPISERELAARAGVGWVGKNTCVINERVGSWIFLGCVLTTLDLPFDTPAPDRCGTCTRCIDACPTSALTPYQLDAPRCISYLNIEHAGAIEESLQTKMGDWLFGCDICQEVCPWNNRAPSTDLPELQPRFADGRLSIDDVLRWQPDDFNRTFRRSAVKRIRLPQLQRNARIAAANRGT